MYYGGGEEMMQEIYARHNIHVNICGIIAPEASGWFREPIKSTADLKGLKMRFFGLGAKVMQKLGGDTQLLAAADIYPALERGAIDATEFSIREKYGVEILGLVLFLLPFVAIAGYYSAAYTYASFLEHEVSKSTVGLSYSWALKVTLPIMFALIGIAVISQLIKAVAGLRGQLPPDQAAEMLGEEI